MSCPPDGKTCPAPRKTRWGRLFLFVFLAYVSICALVLALENKLIHHGARFEEAWNAPPPALAVQDVWLETADGAKTHAWWCPYPGAQDAVLYCHGNGCNLSQCAPMVAEVRSALKSSILIFDYPKYGRSEGELGEAGCYAAGDAAYDWLARQVSPEQITLYGESLGGGIATELATRKKHKALVLVMTYTSIPDMAQKQFPWLPGRWLVRTQFNNLAKIGKCSGPVFVAHGDDDGLIPFEHGEALFAAAQEPKQFFRMKGVGHGAPLTPECLTSLAAFLRRPTPSN